ncbi:MAG: ABC transporter permease, partial [Marivirga sp.]|nr:ABC transporter permease [Marivirga sp.]
MILHYLRIAFRNLERQKLLTFINISGLSIGLACFSLFLLYAVNEFSYDRFHINAPNIYRVYSWWAFTEREGSEPASTTPLGPAMKNDFPDVEAFVRLQGGSEKLVRIDDDVFSINVSFADPQILSVFTFPLIYGNAATALSDQHNIVLTRSKSIQLFGVTDVVGKQVEIKTGEQYETFTVGGITDDIPVNSTIQFDILGNFEYILNSEMGRASIDDWNMTIGIAVYVQLHPSSNLMNDTGRLASFHSKYFPDEAEAVKKEGLWDGKGAYPSSYGLQPLRDVHTNVKVDAWGAVNPKNIWILVGIAGSVLLIACINFIILAIGRSSGRSKEVGVRKIIGGQRKQLIFQFLSESLLLTLFSSVFAIGIAQTLIPFFNDLSGRNLRFSLEQYPEMFMLLAITIVTVGLLAGSYPALVLSGFKPVEALKNRVRLAGSNFFTKSLVTFQFVLSIALIVSTFVILRQLSFMRSKDLGLIKENVVMISARDSDFKRVYPLFRNEVISSTLIAGVTASAIGLGDGEGQMGRAYEVNGKVEGIIEYPIDERFLDVMGMRLV